MTITDKYKKVREKLQDGDIILAHSDKPIATAIQNVDDAYYHHSGIIFTKNDRVFVMDAHPEGGVNPSYLSVRIKKKRWSDFTILRPKETKKILKLLRNVATRGNTKASRRDH